MAVQVQGDEVGGILRTVAVSDVSIALVRPGAAIVPVVLLHDPPGRQRAKGEPASNHDNQSYPHKEQPVKAKTAPVYYPRRLRGLPYYRTCLAPGRVVGIVPFFHRDRNGSFAGRSECLRQIRLVLGM